MSATVGVMLKPLPAIPSFRVDLERQPGRHLVSAHDSFWDVIAQGVERLCALRLPDARTSFTQTFAKQLADVLDASHEQGTSPTESVSRLAARLQDDAHGSDGATIDEFLRVAEEMENAGHLQLAFSMLAHLRSRG